MAPLTDGRVLVAGGRDADSIYATTSAVLYDPASGSWASTGNLNVAREGATATLMRSGKVLVVGGQCSGTMLAHCPWEVSSAVELYDPSTGTFSLVGDLPDGRYRHTVTVLADGRAMIAGGYSCVTTPELWCGESSSVVFYNPADGSLSIGPPMTRSRIRHTATALADGRVLVVGGECISDGCVDPASTAELFDPRTNAWTVTRPPLSRAIYHAAALVGRGQVLVVGGLGGNGSSNSAQLFDARLGSWVAAPPMSFVHYLPRMASLPDGRAIVVGGSGVTPNGAEIYQPLTRTWAPAPSIYPHTDDYFALTQLANGSVMVTGGEASAGAVEAEIYNP
jgi:hypothetical protein